MGRDSKRLAGGADGYFNTRQDENIQGESYPVERMANSPKLNCPIESWRRLPAAFQGETSKKKSASPMKGWSKRMV